MIDLRVRQNALQVLAETALFNSEKAELWTKEDLTHAVMLFQSIAHSVATTTGHLGKFRLEGRLEIATEFGKNLRQTVELFTGIDLTDLVLDAQELDEENE